MSSPFTVQVSTPHIYPIAWATYRTSARTPYAALAAETGTALDRRMARVVVRMGERVVYETEGKL